MPVAWGSSQIGLSSERHTSLFIGESRAESSVLHSSARASAIAYARVNDWPERHAAPPATLKIGQSVPITATLNGVTQTFMVTVGAPTPIGITVQPAPTRRASGASVAPGSPAPAAVPAGR